MKESGEHFYLVNEAAEKVGTTTNIQESRDQIWCLHRDYSEALGNVGYVNLRMEKQHAASRYFMEKLKPTYLKSHTKVIIQSSRSEQFEKKDFDNFILEVKKQARSLQ